MDLAELYRRVRRRFLPRYRWAPVCGVYGWWHVEDLEAYRAGCCVFLRSLPKGRKTVVIEQPNSTRDDGSAWAQGRMVGNGGW